MKRIKHDVRETTQLLKSILHYDVKCKKWNETHVIVMKGNQENITKRLYTLRFMDYIHSGDDFGSKVEVYMEAENYFG